MPAKKATGKKLPLKDNPGEIPGSDFIVFGDGKKSKKKSKANDTAAADLSESTKPSVKQIIGGASWTGKLPVNLLSELCQRQKWNKPDYSMRQVPNKDGGEKQYRSDVTLSKVDAKSRELTKLPPVRLPQEHAGMADQTTALEARHFAATYTLYRLQSMKNIHMTLPPYYRDLWKGEFTALKKEDIKEGRAWKYEEDPFAAEAKRQEIHRAMDKRDQEIKRKQAAQAKEDPHVIRLQNSPDAKVWASAPQANMGQQIRSDIERVVRRRAVWNVHRKTLAVSERQTLLDSLTKLGFRNTHIAEALEFCKDQEEALEWLLIHVPEDDLPRWALPSGYTAGVQLASANLAREAKLKRLARPGFMLDQCIQALIESNEDERTAAQILQDSLLPGSTLSKDLETDNSGQWEEEMQTLGAIFGERFSSMSDTHCLITGCCAKDTKFDVRFRKPELCYPQQVPILAVEADALPAYIKLSATRQALLHAQQDLLGDIMLYSICEWLETNLSAIIEQPGRLSDLQCQTPPRQGISHQPRLDAAKSRRERQSRQDLRSSEEVLKSWKARQDTDAQKRMLQARQNLPAWAKGDEILQAVQRYQVTIISGETGSGKSTQAVQFVLDEAISQLEGAATKIVCTQPRRVASLSLADRVSSERCTAVGDEVGYVIRGDSKVSERTKITFMTTGVLLRRLQSSRDSAQALADISHIFVDEVHERSLDTDFLLALLRDLLSKNDKLKVVLMSATLDADMFTQYFGGRDMVSLVHIEGRTFPVQDIYLDDVLLMTKFRGRGPDFGLETHDQNLAKAIQSLGVGINYDLIQTLVRCIDDELGEQSGSILIFLPGTLEIERCLRSVNTIPNVTGLPLHASLLPAEQRKVFLPAKGGSRKIIAATNVAETSITIEDVVAVIDTGRVKETNYDVSNHIVRLEEVWASQAACQQRRGRAGRVRAGTCYKLFTRNTEAKMPAKTTPEIMRVPLEQLCLSIKATGEDRDVARFLSQTLTPPASGAVSNALKKLHVMDVLVDDRLTALGTYMSLIPADLRCAKLLVYGILFGCLETCLTIASILTVRSPFVSPRDRREEAQAARNRFAGEHGDLLLDTAAFEAWTDMDTQARHREVQDWCNTSFLSFQTLRDISSTRHQLLDSLKDAGLVPTTYRSRAVQDTVNNHSQLLLLRALIAAAIQPQIAEISFPSKKYIASMSGAKELDPEAKTIKFFVPSETADAANIAENTQHQTQRETTSAQGARASRVFIHPSSALFTAQSFTHHASHVSYFAKMMTSKAFIRDLTPMNVYSLLLFGGRLELDTSGQGLVVGGFFKIKGWARIGVLVNRLRILLDEELRQRIEDGRVLLGSLEGNEIIRLVQRLVELNGQDQ